MIGRVAAAVRRRPRWAFFVTLFRVAPGLATLWALLLVVRGALPPALAIGIGVLIGRVADDGARLGPLAVVAALFAALQVLAPVHQAVSAELGERTAAWLYDRLAAGSLRPPGLGHLEDPQIAADLTAARDFDSGVSGPPLFVALGFITDGLVELLAGLSSAAVLFGFAWWAPPLLVAAWGSTHVLLRRSAVWAGRNSDEVRDARRHADYAYRMAVDPPHAKELRLFGLAGWTVERFLTHRRRLHRLEYEATRMRRGPLLAALVVVLAANAVVFTALARAAAGGGLSLPELVVHTQVGVGAALIAFGGLNWSLDGAAAPVALALDLPERSARAGALRAGDAGGTGSPGETEAPGEPEAHGETEAPGGTEARGEPEAIERTGAPGPAALRFRDVSFSYPGSARPVLAGLDLTVPPGRSLAVVGRNGAGKTTLVKLLCRLYDPVTGVIEVGGRPLTDLDVQAWRGTVAAVFQDFLRLELPLRDNVAPLGAPEADIRAALAAAGAGDLRDLDTPLAKGYAGGTDLSGGQWQRIALARAVCAVRLGAGLVVLDEPTAQLDVRGESEIFRRLLEVTAGVTTILVSHRFSTVRQVDRICVLDEGRVAELGSHDELMAAGGRYHRTFRLQAERFAADEVVES